METIQWWWLSSPCLCNLSLRHTEISSLTTDYYHKGDVVWSCLCCIDGCYACCLIYCDVSRRHKDREPHAFFFIICYSRHMWFFEKIFPTQMFELMTEFSQCRSSSGKKRTVQFDPTKMQNAVFDFIRLLQSSDSVLNSILLYWIFFSVFLDYTSGIELINRDTRQKREYHFQWGQLRVST